MTWLALTLKNGVRSLHRYMNYITACTFSVMIFYMFSAFVLNPAVHQGYMTSTAKNLLGACQFIVIVFAVFFIFFFHSALLRLRSKEFGLFLTLGTTPKQIGRLIFVESILLGFVSTCVGMLLGILFSKLFLLILGAALQLPQQIPFAIPGGSVVMTVVFFGLVFLFEAFWVSKRIKRNSPRTLILGQRVRQKTPKFSVWWVLLGMLCLAAGYYLAVEQSRNIIADMFPILILTGAGTYLLFSQVLVMILTVLRRRSLNGVGLLVVSRLAYRLKDNARVLTVVTMLTAMVLTGMGSVLGLQQIVGENALRVNPFNIMLASNQASTSNVDTRQIHQILISHGIQITGETEVPIIVAQVQTTSKQWIPVQVISLSTYDAIRTRFATEPLLKKYLPPIPHFKPGHAELMVPYPLVAPKQLTTSKTKIKIGSVTESINIDHQSDVRVIDKSTALPDFELVVSNSDYLRWERNASHLSKWTIHGFLLSDWKKSLPAVKQVEALVTPSHFSLSATVIGYKQTQQVLSVMLFAGFFISILFFLTAGGSIYFRLDSQQEEDRKQFHILQRMGLKRKEIGRVLAIELFLLFFVPVAMALLHSAIAIVDLGHLVPLTGNAWRVFGSVVGVYCILMFVYFGVSRVKYLRRVTNEQMS